MFKVRRGVAYLMLSGAIFSVQTLMAKDSAAVISSLEVSFWRSLICLTCIFLFIATRVEERDRVNTWFGDPPMRKWLLLRGIFGYSSNALLFASLEFLPIGDANILFFSSPIWSAAIAWIFLRERTGALVFTVIGASLGGVVLTARPWEPPEKERNTEGVFFAIAGSIVQASVFAVLRRIRGVAWYTIMFPQFLLQSIIALGVAYAVGGNFGFEPFTWTLNTWVWRECVAIGMLAFVAQIFMTEGARMEKASVSSATRTIDIPFAILFQVIYFQQSVNILSFIGGLIILLSVLTLAFSKDKDDNAIMQHIAVAQEADHDGGVAFLAAEEGSRGASPEAPPGESDNF
eukprot:GEMP01025905.1.p1 GENE.GEMP01025905.1~~GEMP01025905.1.p1  ORF type:complete len:346 (+),score=74.97 GEMP01025905.1:76-1113(+)